MTLTLLLAACGAPDADPAPSQSDTDSPVDTVDTADTADTADTVLTDGLKGTIDFHTFGELGVVDIQKAFGLAIDKKFMFVAGYALSCPLGDGAFVYEKRDKGDYDFYWTGRWWQGHPQDYQLSIVDESGHYTFSGQLTTFKGNLIYEDLNTYTGVGKIQGTLEIERCDDIAPLHKIY